jgi:uncharacterized phage protein (predicted DNA packaging)
MALTLDEVKTYLRVTDTAEDILIQSFITATSKEIIRRSGKTKVVVDTVESDISSDGIFQTVIKIGVADMYENRGSETPGQVNRFSRTFEGMVQFISMCGDYT